MVVSVEVDAQPRARGSSFLKHMPRGVHRDADRERGGGGDARCERRLRSARVVVGSVSWKPIVLDLAGCVGRQTGRRFVPQCRAQTCATSREPIADVRGSAIYKRTWRWSSRFARCARQRARKQ